MTNTELNAFRTALESRLADLASGNRDALAIESSPDELDRIQHASERDYAMGNLERNSSRLREVRQALHRIDAGTFGVCVECDRNIKPKRLAAVPWAAACIVCQEAEDRGQGMRHGGFEESLAMAV